MDKGSPEIPQVLLKWPEEAEGNHLYRARIVVEVPALSPEPNVFVYTEHGATRLGGNPPSVGQGSLTGYTYPLHFITEGQERSSDASSIEFCGPEYLEVLLGQLKQEQESVRFLMERIARLSNKQHGMEENNQEVGVGSESARS